MSLYNQLSDLKQHNFKAKSNFTKVQVEKVRLEKIKLENDKSKTKEY